MVGQFQLVQNPPQRPAARLTSRNGVGQVELLSHRPHPLAGGVVAEQVDGHALLGPLQPVQDAHRQDRLAAGQQGAVNVQHQGPDLLVKQFL